MSEAVGSPPIVYPKYINLVEVFPGDTLLNVEGEAWLIPEGLRYILIEDGAQVLPTGDRQERVKLQQLKIRARAARGHQR